TPIAFQGGLTGSLFREFALTLAGAVFISGIVALTLSPVMSSWLLKADREERGLVKIINHTFDRIRRGYSRVLDATLRVRPLVYVVWFGLSALGVVMYLFAQGFGELAPTEDQGFILSYVQSSADSTIDRTSFYADAINHDMMAVPEGVQTF